MIKYMQDVLWGDKMNISIRSHCTRFIAVIISVLTAFVLIAVSAAQVSAAEKPSLNRTTIKIIPGISRTLKVEGTTETVTWSSSDKSVAKVSSKGKVTSVGVGTATITAKFGKSTLKCQVTVIPGTIKFNKSSYSVTEGKSINLKAEIKGSKQIGCISWNPAVASASVSKWADNTVSIKVKGKKSGIAAIKLYFLDDPTVYKTVKVKVKSADGTAEITDSIDVDQLSPAEQILYYLNKEREAEGLAPFELDEKMCQAAEIRASEIVDNFSHTRPDGSEYNTTFEEVGFKRRWCAENIAGGKADAEATVQQWMKSTMGHREIILTPEYTHIGTAVVYAPNSRYKYYWDLLFNHE